MFVAAIGVINSTLSAASSALGIFKASKEILQSKPEIIQTTSDIKFNTPIMGVPVWCALVGLSVYVAWNYKRSIERHELKLQNAVLTQHNLDLERHNADLHKIVTTLLEREPNLNTGQQCNTSINDDLVDNSD